MGDGEMRMKETRAGPDTPSRQVITITSILLHPSLILIDNGHFQYNSFPLSLTLLSVHLFQRGSDLTGAVCFSIGLLFKQMGLYWSVAVFGYLMGKCVWLGAREGCVCVRLGFGEGEVRRG
jgi:alpha-1,3-glucosyltransferase